MKEFFTTLFRGIFSYETQIEISITDFVLCMVIALVTGAFLAFAHGFRTRTTKGFLMTLGLLPTVVAIVIMVVNGNIGAGIVTAGAFSLIRFRSIRGTAKEICSIFICMAVGLLVGMGYLAYAVCVSLGLGVIQILCEILPFGRRKTGPERTLKITIPEDLDYMGVFDEIFAQYASFVHLASVKTTNMGSLFRLTYEIKLKHPGQEKELMDAIRVRNGNLEVAIGDVERNMDEL